MLVVESSLSRTPLMLMMCALIVSSVITWKNEEKNFSKKKEQPRFRKFSLSLFSLVLLFLFVSSSLSLHLSLVLKKEDKDGSEDFEKRRRREEEESV